MRRKSKIFPKRVQRQSTVTWNGSELPDSRRRSSACLIGCSRLSASFQAPTRAMGATTSARFGSVGVSLRVDSVGTLRSQVQFNPDPDLPINQWGEGHRSTRLDLCS